MEWAVHNGGFLATKLRKMCGRNVWNPWATSASGRMRSSHVLGTVVVVSKFGSELWFEPEPSRTGPKSSSRFLKFVEPDLLSGLGFGGFLFWPNGFERVRTRSDPSKFHVTSLTSHTDCVDFPPRSAEIPFSATTNFHQPTATSQRTQM